VPGSLRILQGAELVREWRPEGGNPKCFCSACGGALWSVTPDDGEVASVRLGTFDGDPGIRPSYRTFTAYAVSWEAIPDDGLPRYPEQRPA
jgi:hypothetical protein